MYYEVKDKRLGVDENNAYETVKELWLVASESVAEAEATVCKFIENNFPKSDLEVQAVKLSKITNIVKDTACEDDAAYYKLKCEEELEREDDERKPKVIRTFVLCKANTPEAAIAALKASDICGKDVEVTKCEKTKFNGIIVTPKKKK